MKSILLFALSISIFVLKMLLDAIDHPAAAVPINPDSAVITPVIVAFVAVNAPPGVTLNGADANVAFPK